MQWLGLRAAAERHNVRYVDSRCCPVKSSLFRDVSQKDRFSASSLCATNPVTSGRVADHANDVGGGEALGVVELMVVGGGKGHNDGRHACGG